MDEFGEIDRSGSNAEKYTLRQKLFGTDNVQPMWVADMDIATPICVLDAVKNRMKHPVFGYEIMRDEAYEAQCSWMERQHGWHIKREWLSYSTSVVASIGCAIRAFSEEGDEVLVLSPVYPPFFSMVKENDRNLLTHSLQQSNAGEYFFDIETLRMQMTKKTKILLLCSPHNPVGRVWREDELRALGALCLEYGVVIVSDEVHCDIVFKGHKHIPIASISRELEENTVTLLGPGKTFNMAGFGISNVCIASEKLRAIYAEERRKVHFGDGAVLSHTAFEAAYTHGEKWHNDLISHLQSNREKIVQWSSHSSTIKIFPPQGTYLAWLDCRMLGLGDRELREFFIHKCGLGLSAGLSFGREGTGYMRLNFAVSTELLERALTKISDALYRSEYESKN